MTDDDAAGRKPENLRFRWLMMGGLILLLLAALPLAVWLDLSSLGETALRRQASDLNSVISSVRAYYGSNVVGRVLAAHGKETQVVHNYEDIPGAIPIPATLSLELGKVISEQQQNITYRFVSDFPFKNRAPHPLGHRRLLDAPRAVIAALRTEPLRPRPDSSPRHERGQHGPPSRGDAGGGDPRFRRGRARRMV